MKKMIVVAVLGLFGTQFANAQVKKGNILVAGTVGISSNTTKPDGSDDKNTTTNFTVAPAVGYAVSDKWVVGVYVDGQFGSTKEEIAGVENKSSDNSITPGIFVRNYHNLGEKVAFFGQANVGYGFGSGKTNDTKDYTFSGISAGVNPGIAYFVTKRFTLEGIFGGLNYENFTRKDEETGAKTKSSAIDFDFTRSFAVGVSWLF